MTNGNGYIRVISGNTSRLLADEVCGILKIDTTDAMVESYNDGSPRVRIRESVRGEKVYIINQTGFPDRNLTEMVHLSRAVWCSGGTPIMIIPYIGDNRADKRDEPHAAPGAVIHIDTLMVGKPSMAVVYDPHAETTMEFFGCPSAKLYSSFVIGPHLKSLVAGREHEFATASPDAGRSKAAKWYADYLGIELCGDLSKYRPAAGQTDRDLVRCGFDPIGKKIILIDDIVDTGGTIADAAGKLYELGAENVYVCAVHAVLSKNALERMDKAMVTEFITTNTIYHSPEELKTEKMKVTVLSIAPLVARTIKRLHNNKALSPLIIQKERLMELELDKLLNECPHYSKEEDDEGECSFRGLGHECWIRSKKDLLHCKGYPRSES